MGPPTRGRERNFRLIFGRNEIAALMGLFRSMAVRPAVPSSFFSLMTKLRASSRTFPGKLCFAAGEG